MRYWALCSHRMMLLAPRVCSVPLWSHLPNRGPDPELAPRRLMDHQGQREAKRKWPTRPTSHIRKLRPSCGKAFVKKQNKTTHSQIHGAIRDLRLLPALSGGPLRDAPVTGLRRALRFILCRWTHRPRTLTGSFTFFLKIHRHRKMCEDG